jgi:hypothetical protein
VIFVLVALYLVTWVGGWISHNHEMEQRAQLAYDGLASRYKNSDSPLKKLYLFDDGPRSGVNWCVPLLPGVLLADSHFLTGGLSGNYCYRIVIYYGFGSFVLCETQYLLI